jgi:hypothetical protein
MMMMMMMMMMMITNNIHQSRSENRVTFPGISMEILSPLRRLHIEDSHLERDLDLQPANKGLNIGWFCLYIILAVY